MGKPFNHNSPLDYIQSGVKAHTSDGKAHDHRNSILLTAATGPTASKNGNNGNDRQSSRPATNSPIGRKQSVKSEEDEVATRNECAEIISVSPPPPAPPPDTHDPGKESTAVTLEEKPGWPSRMRAGSTRFLDHTKDAIAHSWINVLLVFVPIGIAINWAPIPGNAKPTVVFALNAVAIIPLAGLLSHATESVASRLGDTWASLLNVTFGNSVELIIL